MFAAGAQSAETQRVEGPDPPETDMRL